MNKIYKEIENGINYLVIEDNDYYSWKNIIENNFWYKIPKIYKKSKDIKFIINYNNYKNIIAYYHNRKEHNIYGASCITMTPSTGWYYNNWFIYGKEYFDMNEWEKDSNSIIRKKKIQILNRI